VKASQAQDRGDRRVELVDAGFEVEQRLGTEARVRRLQTGRDHFGRRIDQAAARLARHLLERIEQVPQLAELQRPHLETAAADRDRLAHRSTH
jgi:hypothetical protein